MVFLLCITPMWTVLSIGQMKQHTSMACQGSQETLIKAYLMAWNALVEKREDFMEEWTEQLQSENLLEGYRAEKFIEYTDGAEPLTKMDTDFMLKTLDHIKVFEDGTLLLVFLDGTEIECKNEEE